MIFALDLATVLTLRIVDQPLSGAAAQRDTATGTAQPSPFDPWYHTPASVPASELAVGSPVQLNAQIQRVRQREMDDHSDLLLTIAEVAVAFAGFASITVLFRGRGAGKWAIPDVFRYGAMLRGSLCACLFSLLPIVLFRAGISEYWTWTLSSAGLLAYSTLMSRVFVVLFRVGARANAEIARNAIAVGLNFSLQLLNLLGLGFDREAAPVLLGVGLLLANAGANFYRLVVVTPSEAGPPNDPGDSLHESS